MGPIVKFLSSKVQLSAYLLISLRIFDSIFLQNRELVFSVRYKKSLFEERLKP